MRILPEKFGVIIGSPRSNEGSNGRDIGQRPSGGSNEGYRRRRKPPILGLLVIIRSQAKLPTRTSKIQLKFRSTDFVNFIMAWTDGKTARVLDYCR